MAASIFNKLQIRASQTLKGLTKSKGLILMYHRVADLEIDPWELAVTPENFSAHLSILTKQAQPMSLAELVRHQKSGKVPERAVAITFDDGYSDNLYRAKPIIDHYQVPASVFVATGYSERNREFWWDELENIFFQTTTLPERLSLVLDGRNYTWDLGKAVSYTDVEKELDRSTPPWSAKPQTRMHLYFSVWETLFKLPELERRKALDTIIEWSNLEPPTRPLYLPMSPQELETLESSGWIEIGAHTVNHPALSFQSVETQRAEINQSKDYLEDTLSHTIQLFTFPFGNFSKSTISLAKQAGFICACATNEDTVWRWSNPYCLPRFGVCNWTGKEFEEKLTQWFND